jgi:hypothetical protein
MSEFTIHSESIDVERIMEQIRIRIREKRGEDYTEEQIREMANVKLDRFMDPKSVRSELVEHYRTRLKEKEAALRNIPAAPPTFEFDPDIVYRSSRGAAGQILYMIRRMLSPILKFFINPAPILHALTLQAEINARQAEVITKMAQTQAEFIEIAALNYEVMNNLVVEMTRLSIDMKNHKMSVESVAGRLDFNERRARSLEKVVQYRDGAATTPRTSTDQTAPDASGSPERKRRRRRRGRRRPTGAVAQSAGATSAESMGDTAATAAEPTGDAAATSAEPTGDTAVTSTEPTGDTAVTSAEPTSDTPAPAPTEASHTASAAATDPVAHETAPPPPQPADEASSETRQAPGDKAPSTEGDPSDR